MTLFRLKSAPFMLLEDDVNKNVLPLLLELVQEEKNLTIFCYEHPVNLWKNVFKSQPHVVCYKEFDESLFSKSEGKGSVIIDSVNQMALFMGWNACLRYLKQLQNDENIHRLIVIFHTDCMSHSSKLQIHLNHIANAIVSYDTKNPCKVRIQLKKGSKVMKSEEVLSYDTRTNTLKLSPVVKEDKRVEEAEKPSPGELSTFKIEVEQTEKIQKYKLKLPYMSKIHEGESKVFYEPDAVDDWDEEDPDEDLDI